MGNGEIKLDGTSKSCVDIGRARVLETCKRQLHARLKTASLPIETTTFGVLVYGKKKKARFVLGSFILIFFIRASTFFRVKISSNLRKKFGSPLWML